MCYDDDILLSFTAGSKPLPDDGVGALGTCVAAMAQLCKLVISHLPLPVLKALAERKEPLEYLDVRSLPGVNWVSSYVFCQCAHNTVLLVAVCSVGWLVSSDYCPCVCVYVCMFVGEMIVCVSCHKCHHVHTCDRMWDMSAASSICLF